MAGSLLVVATPIGNLGDLSPRAAEALRDADLVLAEDTRRTGRLLAHVGSAAPQRSFHDHNERGRIPEVLDELRAGRRVVLVSDAGTPGVSDPGYRLVAACVEAGVVVEALPGPSAVVAALVVSGLPTDRVAFEGFLPRREGVRAVRLAKLAGEDRTMVLFASPHRVAADLEDLASALGGGRRAVLARELTKLHEEVVRGTLDELVTFAGDGVRGEVTLVVAGSPGTGTPAGDEQLAEEVRARVDSGSSTRDAVREVASRLGVSRRRVYQAAVESDPRPPRPG